MKKLLFILIGLAVSFLTFGQGVPVTANPLILPKTVVRPAAPTTGGKLYDYNHFPEWRDSVRYSRLIRGIDLISSRDSLQKALDSLAHYVMRSDSTTVFATPTQVAKSQNNFVQKNELGSAAMADVSQFVQVKDPIKVVIATNGENGIVIPKYLDTSTKIFYNGYFIDSSFWTGIGTNILTVALDTRIYDTILITN